MQHDRREVAEGPRKSPSDHRTTGREALSDDSLIGAIYRADRTIFACRDDEEFAGMGTTVVALRLREDGSRQRDAEYGLEVVREEDIAHMIPCDPETEGIVEGVRHFVDAGFERVALAQVGDRQEEFCEIFGSELAEALRDL